MYVILAVYWHIMPLFFFGSVEIADKKTKKETERRTGREAVRIGTVTEGPKTRIRNPGMSCLLTSMYASFLNLDTNTLA